MDKKSEGFIRLLDDLEKKADLSREESIDLLKKIRDGTATDEDWKKLEKI